MVELKIQGTPDLAVPHAIHPRHTKRISHYTGTDLRSDLPYRHTDRPEPRAHLAEARCHRASADSDPNPDTIHL